MVVMIKLLTLLVISLSTMGFTIHDGDTITKISYRLAYIDAPELKQTCIANGNVLNIGEESRDYLNSISSGKLSNCLLKETDKYGRFIMDCDFNLQMVESGNAICYDEYIKNGFILNRCNHLQNEAKANKLGMWRCDTHTSPSEFRKKK